MAYNLNKNRIKPMFYDFLSFAFTYNNRRTIA